MWQVDGEEEDCNLEQPEDEEGAIEAVDECRHVPHVPIRTHKFNTGISSIDRQGEVCPVSASKGWEKVRA